jgi:hypothetical protein
VADKKEKKAKARVKKKLEEEFGFTRRGKQPTEFSRRTVYGPKNPEPIVVPGRSKLSRDEQKKILSRSKKASARGRRLLKLQAFGPLPKQPRSREEGALQEAAHRRAYARRTFRRLAEKYHTSKLPKGDAALIRTNASKAKGKLYDEALGFGRAKAKYIKKIAKRFGPLGAAFALRERRKKNAN